MIVKSISSMNQILSSDVIKHSSNNCFVVNFIQCCPTFYQLHLHCCVSFHLINISGVANLVNANQQVLFDVWISFMSFISPMLRILSKLLSYRILERVVGHFHALQLQLIFHCLSPPIMHKKMRIIPYRIAIFNKLQLKQHIP
jgi:hypothetical protein